MFCRCSGSNSQNVLFREQPSRIEKRSSSWVVSLMILSNIHWHQPLQFHSHIIHEFNIYQHLGHGQMLIHMLYMEYVGMSYHHASGCSMEGMDEPGWRRPLLRRISADLRWPWNEHVSNYDYHHFQYHCTSLPMFGLDSPLFCCAISEDRCSTDLLTIYIFIYQIFWSIVIE